MKDKIQQLKAIIEKHQNILFFGGAGVSTESGIPDFRSESGLYYAREHYGYSPEQMLSHSFFVAKPEEFYRYYRENILHPEARPNPAHRGLAAMEAEGKLKGVITQNIDGLHQMAGSQVVQELHGSVLRNYCTRCGEPHSLDYVVKYPETVPRCRICGGMVKPDVVLYEEALDEEVLETSIRLIREAEDALTRYEPRIRQVSISVDRNDHLRGVIYLNIDYYVRATNNPNNLVFPYYLEEGIGEL